MAAAWDFIWIITSFEPLIAVVISLHGSLSLILFGVGALHVISLSLTISVISYLAILIAWFNCGGFSFLRRFCHGCSSNSSGTQKLSQQGVVGLQQIFLAGRWYFCGCALPGALLPAHTAWEAACTGHPCLFWDCFFLPRKIIQEVNSLRQQEGLVWRKPKVDLTDNLPAPIWSFYQQLSRLPLPASVRGLQHPVGIKAKGLFPDLQHRDWSGLVGFSQILLSSCG